MAYVEDEADLNHYLEEEEEDDSCENVCAICDNGGNLLCCEGSCLRSFHATKKDGQQSFCDSLGLTKKQVEAIQNYFCPNCEHKKHQCFICKQLGSSDNSLGAAEVFQCGSATCGYYYHPRCVVREQRLGDNKAEAEALERQIVAGEFTCPLHKCIMCGRGEVKTDYNLQFAVCQRCPKSFHRKCLPRDISFEDIDDEAITIRAWEGLLHNRVLIYCMEHEIDEDIRTPTRNHIKFPITEEKKSFLKEKKKILESHVGRAKAKDVPKASSKDGGVSTRKHELASSVPDNPRKRKELDSSKMYKTEPQKSRKTKHECVVKIDSIPSKEPGSETPTLDNNSHERIPAITNEATKEPTTDFVFKKRKVPSTSSNSTRNVMDKTGSVQAVGTSSKKLGEEGSMEEDISVVCSSSYNTAPQRSHDSVEASLPVNSGDDIRTPDQFPLTPSKRNGANETSDNLGYSDLNRALDTRGYLDPKLSPPTPNLMDNASPMFDQTNEEGIPPVQPSGHNVYDPLQPPQAGYFGISQMGFALGPNYLYMNSSCGWLDD